MQPALRCSRTGQPYPTLLCHGGDSQTVRRSSNTTTTTTTTNVPVCVGCCMHSASGQQNGQSDVGGPSRRFVGWGSPRRSNCAMQEHQGRRPRADREERERPSGSPAGLTAPCLFPLLLALHRPSMLTSPPCARFSAVLVSEPLAHAGCVGGCGPCPLLLLLLLLFGQASSSLGALAVFVVNGGSIDRRERREGRREGRVEQGWTGRSILSLPS